MSAPDNVPGNDSLTFEVNPGDYGVGRVAVCLYMSLILPGVAVKATAQAYSDSYEPLQLWYNQPATYWQEVLNKVLLQ